MKGWTVVVAIALSSSACNECDFWQRCGEQPGELVVCGEGVDQQIGREERTVTCAAPNTTCVDLTEEYGACAYSTSSCSEGDPPRCDGAVLVRCLQVGDTADVVFGDISGGADTELVESGETCANGCVDGDAGAACAE